MDQKNDYLIYRSNKEFIEEIKQRNYVAMSPDKMLKVVERVKVLESLAQNKNTIIVLACLKSTKIYYISSNVKTKLGYEPEEYQKDNDKGFFKLFSKSSLGLPLLLSKWFSIVRSKTNTSKKYFNFYFSGVKLQHKSGESHTYFGRIVSLLKYNDENSLSICFYENSEHLMKSDLFWAYFVSEKKEYTRFFSTKLKEKGLPTIVTKREKEILEQINSGKSTKDISKSLEISGNTVDRHRKNMLAKLGAKDSTALLQLCKMCNIL